MSCVNSGSCHSCGLVNIVLLADLVAVLVMFAPFPFLGSYVMYCLLAWGIIPLNTVQNSISCVFPYEPHVIVLRVLSL